MNRITIGIIGGSGNMGRWFKCFFESTGHTVLIAGRKTALTYANLARQSDVVMLSVPVGAVEGVCREIGPILGPSQLLMDICSLKESVLKSMLAIPSAQVVGTHPLFGPATENLQGQNIIICPGRGSDRLEWLEDVFQTGGAVLTRMDPIEHDRNMAVVQGLTHFLTITLGRTLQKLNLKPRDASRVATPVFRTQLDLIGRLFAQDLELYQDLIRNNPHTETILKAFLTALGESRRVLIDSDSGTAGSDFMGEIHSFLKDYCEQGLNESNRFLNTLYPGSDKFNL
ncbi:MAG: prephenate dehydrogenase/arogenate dehydrogenase family protein [Desulfobacterales bacterium]|nr:prephenate dehydrogenase/arogenate dehydrogenase family protein [Desulfobacterales bacterium]